jgi:protein phosphatase
MEFKSVSFSHRGGRRKHNEDAFLERPDQAVWVVADGMGGYAAGDIASRLICDAVADAMKHSSRSLSATVLERALYRANERIEQYGKDKLGGEILGSTVVALLLESDRYHLFWAGDSRCYRSRGGSLTQLSRDHSQVMDMVDKGLLKLEEAEKHPLAHVITRALGVDATTEVEYQTGEMQRGDGFMLCSDGVSKEFSQHELAALVNGGHMEDASLAIMHSALVKECNDNITCIIVKPDFSCYRSSLNCHIEDATVPVKPRECDGPQ